MAYVFRMRPSRQNTCRNTAYSGILCHIFGDNSSGADACATAYLNPVDNICPGTDIDSITDNGSTLCVVAAYRGHLTNVDIVTQYGFRVDNCATAVLNVQSITNASTWGNQQPISFVAT